MVRARFRSRGRGERRARRGRDGAEPFTFTVRRRALKAGRRYRVRASARLYDGRAGPGQRRFQASGSSVRAVIDAGTVPPATSASVTCSSTSRRLDRSAIHTVASSLADPS